MKRTVIYSISAIVLVLLIAASVMAVSFLRPIFQISENTYLYIYPDDDVNTVNDRIDSLAHPSAPLSFATLAEITGKTQSLKKGRYEVSSQMNMLTLLRNICNHHQTPVNLVLPSVRTVEILSGKMSGKLMTDSVSLVRLLHDSVFCESLGFDQQTIPAMFIPNTYEVYWDTDAEKLLQRLKREYDVFWNESRTQKAKAMSMSFVEISTLASIVDAETDNNAEMPRIAGLYLNRLAIDMPLQSDPTVIYGIHDFSIRRVTHAHLQYDSPYNTYTNTGLPPGPVRIPSIAAIDAVLNHENNQYLYMCAKEDFSGTHNFAVTYSEHQKNARRYTSALNQRGIR